MHAYALTPYDNCRSWVLPDTVTCSIPRSGAGFDCGAYNIARGVLIETARLTDARMVQLSLRERDVCCSGPCCTDRTRPVHYCEITVRAQLEFPGARPLVVMLRYWRPWISDLAATGHDHEGWTLHVGLDLLATGGERAPVPTPSWIALAVYRHLRGW